MNKRVKSPARGRRSLVRPKSGLSPVSLLLIGGVITVFGGAVGAFIQSYFSQRGAERQLGQQVVANAAGKDADSAMSMLRTVLNTHMLDAETQRKLEPVVGAFEAKKQSELAKVERLQQNLENERRDATALAEQKGRELNDWKSRFAILESTTKIQLDGYRERENILTKGMATTLATLKELNAQVPTPKKEREGDSTKIAKLDGPGQQKGGLDMGDSISGSKQSGSEYYGSPDPR